MVGNRYRIHIGVDFATVLTKTLQLLEDQQEFYSSKLGKEKKEGRHSGKKKSTESKHHPKRNDPTQLSEEAFVKAQRRDSTFLLDQSDHRPWRAVSRAAPVAADLSWLSVAGHGWHLHRHGQLEATEGPFWHGQQRQRQTACTSPDGHVAVSFGPIAVPVRTVPPGQRGSDNRSSPRETLSPNDLVLLDACFWSYGLFWDIQNRGAFFAVALKGKKINLRRIRSLGQQDQLMCSESKDSRGQWEKEKLPKSIELRVITYRIPGFRTQKLVTNVRNDARIPREDWVRLASDCTENGQFKLDLYHRRWEIETTYRELKVEPGMNGNLRSRSPESIQF